MLKYNDICVGISTYNGEKTLEKTLKSLEEQTFKNFSVLISDDNSSDNTINIIKNFSKRNKNFFYEVNEKNLGMISNYNKLFLKSNSKYFTWIDQDDYREKNFLKECYTKIEENPEASLVYAHTGVRNKKNNMLMHINTIRSISGKKEVDVRYKNLLNNFHDTIIYSLIRSSCLKNTTLWTGINGSANRLIFDLALEGEFLEVNKLLAFYNGKGLVNRNSVDDEFFRQIKKKRKFYQIPFLTLFIYQNKDIFLKKIKYYKKIKIFIFLFINFIKINFAKFIYRLFSKFFFGIIDNYIYELILRLIPENSDINQIVEKKHFKDFYPLHYPYKKVKGIKYNKLS